MDIGHNREAFCWKHNFMFRAPESYLQSASPLSPWGHVTTKEAKRRSLRLAMKLGCPVTQGGLEPDKDTLKVGSSYKYTWKIDHRKQIVTFLKASHLMSIF